MFSLGVRRIISLSRTQIFMLHPREHPVHILSVCDISQTLALNRKSRDVNAPTGHSSITFIAYGLSSFLPGNVSMVTFSPRLTNVSCGSLATSSQNLMQREQLMQRSWSNITFGPSSTRL